MEILHISDTHGKHRLIKELPKADMIVHTGDMTEDGKVSEMMDFLEWFCDLDYRHKIFVGGNHDLCLDGGQIDGLLDNCHYLNQSGVEIEGLKIWGVPYFLSKELTTGQSWAKIPDNTDILVSHRPPYGILDFDRNEHFGCLEILQSVQRIRPRYHLFGHVHAGYGIEKSQYTTFVNASLVRNNQVRNEPITIHFVSHQQ